MRTEAADLAVHADVVEVELGGGGLARVVLGRVVHGKDGLLAEARVVIKANLGIKADNCRNGIGLARGREMVGKERKSDGKQRK